MVEGPFAHWPLRPMRSSDLPTLVQIDAEVRAQPWTSATFEAEMANPLSRPMVVLQRAKLVGYGLSWVVADEVQIHYLAVSRRGRGLGYGELLLFDALAAAVGQGAVWATLEVRQTNAPARALYTKYGFVEVGRRPAYYRESGEDAVLMNARLDTADFISLWRRHRAALTSRFAVKRP